MGAQGVAAAPPLYGVQVVDDGQVRGGVLQRKAKQRGPWEHAPPTLTARGGQTADPSQPPPLRLATDQPTFVHGWPGHGRAENRGETEFRTTWYPGPITGEVDFKIRRIPLSGLPLFPHTGRAIVLVPEYDDRRPITAVDVFVYLHGIGRRPDPVKNRGYTAVETGYDDLRDVDVARVDEQVAQHVRGSGRPTVAILPQGDWRSFGNSRKGTPKALLDGTLVGQVLGDLFGGRPVTVLNTVVAAHSGGGNTLIPTLSGWKPDAEQVREVVLFEAINGDYQLELAQQFLARWLAHDVEQVKQADSPEAAAAYLERSTRFRGYYTQNGSYAARYAKLAAFLDQRLATIKLDPAIVAALRRNYRVIAVGSAQGLGHGTVMAPGKRDGIGGIFESLQALPPVQKRGPTAGHDPHEVHADRVAANVAAGGEFKDTGAPESSPAHADPHDMTWARRGLSSPGRTLDPTTREFMERRFHRDFGGVRVHTDATAAAAARALDASAYTVGTRIAFGDGQYAPHSRDGRFLLAHELTHVVQQRATGPAVQARGKRKPAPPPAPEIDQEVVAEIDRLTTEVHAIVAADPTLIDDWPEIARQITAPVTGAALAARHEADAKAGKPAAKQPDPYAVSQRLKPLYAEALTVRLDKLKDIVLGQGKAAEPALRRIAAGVLGKLGGQLVQQVAAVVADAADPALTEATFKPGWAAVRAQFNDPKTRAGAAPAALAASPLYSTDTADRLRRGKALVQQSAPKVPAKRLGAATLEQVQQLLVTRLGARTKVDYAAEFATLEPVVRQNVEAGIAGYVTARAGLFAQFGDVAGINRFYKSVQPASFVGRSVLVHTSMATRLAAAEALLAKNGWLKDAQTGIRSAGGFNIRENRNRPTQLSNHSFGFALDIDPNINPNVKNFPTALVESVTGEDVYAGASMKTARDGGTAAQLLPALDKLRASSDLFRDTLASEDSVVATLIARLGEHGIAVGKDIDRKVLRKLDPKLLQAWLVKASAPKPDPAATPAATTPPAPDPKAAAARKKEEEERAKKIQQLLPDLLTIYRAYQRSHPGGKPVAASAIGTPETVAAHGFLNLPAKLIAAMSGSDGGGLVWLGTAKHTKDFMHFELPAADRSQALKAAAAASEAEEGEVEESDADEPTSAEP